jgi:hypothetical protein
MQNDFDLYGLNPFYFEIVETVKERKDMSARERYWIEYFNSGKPNGYNTQIKGKK